MPAGDSGRPWPQMVPDCMMCKHWLVARPLVFDNATGCVITGASTAQSRKLGLRDLELLLYQKTAVFDLSLFHACQRMFALLLATSASKICGKTSSILCLPLNSMKRNSFIFSTSFKYRR